jgi:hypothetical protein
MLKKMDRWEMLKAIGLDPSPYWEKRHFPAEDCTTVYNGDKNVLESSNYYLCCIMDTSSTHTSYASIRTLKPYLYVDEETKEVYYGWIDSCGNLYDHQERDIHNDRERVVAWKKL